MTFAIIGNGAIAQYVLRRLSERGHHVAAQILRPARLEAMGEADQASPLRIATHADMPAHVRHVIDCAGHSGLSEHGPGLCRRDMTLPRCRLAPWRTRRCSTR